MWLFYTHRLWVTLVAAYTHCEFTIKPTYAHMVLPIATKLGTLTCMGSVVFMCPDV